MGGGSEKAVEKQHVLSVQSWNKLAKVQHTRKWRPTGRDGS